MARLSSHVLSWLAVCLLALAACTPRSADTPTPQPIATSDTTQEPSPEARSTAEESAAQTPWVRNRIKALEGLYPFTRTGVEWLERYDLRQMVGQPGWFGSYGYDSWAGVGQAKPVQIIHELSHSYYGAFPVTGRPDLTWHKSSSNELSPALRQYREDLATFMAQPPDRYEPLRDRFRNLPNLSRPEDPDLFHFGEADLVYMVGGNLNLVPPILDRYFDQLLGPGEFQTWEGAITWYLGLPRDQARVAEGYFGLAHFPLSNYQGLRTSVSTQVAPEVQAILEEEERQRLKDFANQYELIKEKEFGALDEESFEGSFKFWRGLLQDMLGLHRKHPETLAKDGGTQGAQIAAAFDTFLKAEGLSQEQQVQLFIQALQNPLMRDFTVLLKSRALVDLMRETSRDDSEEPIGVVTRKFAEKFNQYLTEVEDVVSIGRQDRGRGALALEQLLDGMSDKEQKENLGVILDMLRDSDRTIARDLLISIDYATVLRMVENNPGAAKNGHFQPERLLEALDITPQARRDDITAGIRWLLKNTAGNFQIDAPFTKLAHKVIADISDDNPNEALTILQEAQLPLIAQPYAPFLMDQPQAAISILSSDLERAASLIANREGYAETPHGVIHALIFHDPELAGKLVDTLDAMGRDDIATNSIIVFAYDARRLATYLDIELSLENDKRFLEYLVQAKGRQWVQETMTKAVRRYDEIALAGLMDKEFVLAYGETLNRVLALEMEPSKRQILREAFEVAFRDADVGSPI